MAGLAPVNVPGAGGGCLLHGGVKEVGASIEWRDFEPAGTFDWAEVLHSDCLSLCLNLAGRGVVRSGADHATFEPLTGGIFVRSRGGFQATRQAGSRHRFVTIQFSAAYLRRRLAEADGALHPLVEQFIAENQAAQGHGGIRRLTAEQEQMALQFVHPPVVQAARALWYESKLLGFMVDFLFQPSKADALFCDRQKRLARERSDRVIALLRARLADPPSLEEIGRSVGCSPFHLSRTFSRETGVTIPQYLRKLRMERAAELLRSGRFNVTEAALEVGYSSLSHFSQAFCDTMGCCPCLYPHAKALIR